jgi:hypothetical protein
MNKCIIACPKVIDKNFTKNLHKGHGQAKGYFDLAWEYPRKMA